MIAFLVAEIKCNWKWIWVYTILKSTLDFWTWHVDVEYFWGYNVLSALAKCHAAIFVAYFSTFRPPPPHTQNLWCHLQYTCTSKSFRVWMSHQSGGINIFCCRCSGSETTYLFGTDCMNSDLRQTLVTFYYFIVRSVVVDVTGSQCFSAAFDITHDIPWHCFLFVEHWGKRVWAMAAIVVTAAERYSNPASSFALWKRIRKLRT